MIWLLVTGLLSILGQVVLLRELSVASYGVELVYLVGLGVWLTSSAAGALIPGRTAKPSGASLAAATVAAAILIPLDVAFVRSSRIVMGTVPGAYLPLSRQFAVALAALAPLAITLGWLFRRAALAHVLRGGRLAGAYGWECLGGLAGGAASVFLPHLGVTNAAQALVACAIGLAAPVAAWRDLPRWIRFASPGLFAVALATLPGAHAADLAMTRWTHPGLVDSVDTPYARVTATRSDGQLSVFENDALLFESSGVEGEVLGHLAALHHPNPRRILLLGGGAEGLVATLLAHRPARLDHVELDRVMFERLAPLLGADARSLLAGPGVVTEFADPRTFLDTAEAHDLIVVALAGPSSAQSNRYYTREFFTQVESRLAPGGVLAFRLRLPENAWTPVETALAASIWKALGRAFQHRTVLPGPVSVLVASNDPLPTGAEPLVERFHQRLIQARLVSPPFLRYAYDNDRRVDVARRLDASPAAANTDARPVCYQLASWLWLSKLVPSLAGARPAASEPLRTRDLAAAIALTTLAALLAGAATRRRPLAGRVLLVGFGAFGGMLVETVLLLHYQSHRGVLYQDVGALLTSFMAGLAAGAFALDRAASRRIGRTGDGPDGRRHPRWRRSGDDRGHRLRSGTWPLELDGAPGVGRRRRGRPVRPRQSGHAAPGRQPRGLSVRGRPGGRSHGGSRRERRAGSSAGTAGDLRPGARRHRSLPRPARLAGQIALTRPGSRTSCGAQEVSVFRHLRRPTCLSSDPAD